MTRRDTNMFSEITLLEYLFGHTACSELTTLIAEG
jgi:hypothetical protein